MIEYSKQRISTECEALKSFEKSLCVLSSEDFLHRTFLPSCEAHLPDSYTAQILPMEGVKREADASIAAEIVLRLKNVERKLHILEVGAGATIPTHKSFGAPWLARVLSCAFPERIEVTVSDKAATLIPEIEAHIFGVNVLPEISLSDIVKLQKQYDVIFARHLPVDAYMTPEFKYGSPQVLNVLARDGVGIFAQDSGDILRVHYYDVPCPSEECTSALRDIYDGVSLGYGG